MKALRMPRLTFIKSEIENLIAAAKAHRNPINLVGDQGVYFATVTFQKRPPLCVCAVGCHPTKNAFDDWWELKRRTFGPDDGVEPVSLATMEAWVKHTSGGVLTLQINQHSITHVTDAKTAVDAAPRSPPDMFDVKNDDRAARAQAALKFYADHKGQALKASSAQISDLISDLLHLSAYRGCGPKEVDGIVSLARLNHAGEDDLDSRRVTAG